MYRKNSKKSKKNDDFSSSKTIYDELKRNNINYNDLVKFYKIKKVFDEFKEITPEIIKKFEEKIEVPVSIFSKKLSCLETVVKYLRENLNLSNKEIAKLIKRSEKTIWQAYNSARKKYSSKFFIEFSKYYISVSVLSDRKLSVLENIVKYLHENFELNYSEIARLLCRDNRTIWTVYSRARKKYGKRK